MQPYQEEYLANLRQFAALSSGLPPEELPPEAFLADAAQRQAQVTRLVRRNIELLRSGLFPTLDHLFSAGAEELEELRTFSFQLYDGRTELDVGLFCHIRQALLSLARQKRDRPAMIRELYWLGMGRNALCSKLVGFELPDVERYMTRMRLCFTEAAAYLKYYDEIEDTETRGYILRAKANISLGQFKSPSEKIRLVKDTLQVLQDRDYQEKAPGLPWDRFIYLTHQNMASSISYSKEKVMTAQDMADIMESAYIVYQRRFQEAEQLHKQPPAKSAFAYHAIEYYCGFYGLDTLLSKLEGLLDGGSGGDYSTDGMYVMISLPAFYSQYLQQYPELIPPRREYLEQLYRRILDYVDACPRQAEDGQLFLYLRQLSFTFVETGGVSYGEFLQKLLLRFAPELYLHSRAVGEGARALCRLILEDDPGFFDDAGFLQAIQDPAEKRREVLDYALGCGLFHDVGKLSVIELYSRTARQWFREESEMARLHVIAGETLLSQRPSTRRYAPAALGHHAWYDGSRGYPDAYRRLECPCRQMVDVVALVDWLESTSSSTQIYNGEALTYEETVQSAVQLEGRRFSPLLTARLRDAGTAQLLRRAMEEGRRAALLQTRGPADPPAPALP
ncbi:MAG: hypothetical protein HFF26_03460 [Oscillospiraceae bacterium]|nr:hypothetical protein [Oscillospiraceae bacterium]